MAFNVHGVGVILNTEDGSFSDYVASNLGAFRSDLAAEPDIRVSYTFGTDGYEIEPREDMERIGRSLWQGPQEVVFRSRGLEVLARLVEGGQLEIDARYHLRSPSISQPRRLLRRIRGKDRFESRKQEATHFSARMAFHLPLLWFLTRRRGFSLIHGSSVCVDERALIFAGLNNSGKSTLAASLYFFKGWPQLSDNFTIVDDRSVFAYPESQRISVDMIPLLSPGKGGVTTYGKIHLQQEKRIPLETEVEAIYFVSFGRSASIREMSPEEGLRRIQAIHDYISEFPEYTYLRFLENEGFAQIGNRLEVLFRHSRIYALTQSMKPDLDQTHRLIEGTLSHAH